MYRQSWSDWSDINGFVVRVWCCELPICFNVLFHQVSTQDRRLGAKVFIVLSGLQINRGSYMSAHVLFNLLNKFGKSDKMLGLPVILSLFRNKFNKFNNTLA